MSRETAKAPAKKVRPYEDTQMLVLHELVRHANRFQRSEKYSLVDERGESFSLSFWSDYHVRETVIIPAGTPQAQHKLQLAIDTMRKRIEQLRHAFGRYKLEEGRLDGRLEDRLRELEQAKERTAADAGEAREG